MNDDAALAAGTGDAKLLDVTFTARAENLKEIRRAVRDAVKRAGCQDRIADDIVIAIDEACQNVIRHAYGGDSDEPIELAMQVNGGELIARIRDNAPTVDAAAITPRDLDDLRPGGLGTHFMREIMDSVDYAAGSSERGNLLTMRKKIG